MKQLRGKRALITGTASGIGRQIALRLAGEGTHLLLADRDELGMARTADEVRQLGVDVVTQHYDALVPESIAALARFAHDLPGGIDILINNAGIAYHGPTAQMNQEDFDRVLAVNLHSHIQLTQQLLPSLLMHRDVHIVNVCSVLGLVGLPKVCAYNAAKFGLVGYSESLRSEYGPQGVGVTALCPGLVRTNLFDAAGAETGKQAKAPPRWATTTAEQVAKAAVKAIKRNRGVVVVEPIAKTVCLFKRMAPGLLDFLLHLGRGRRRTDKRVAYWLRQHELQQATVEQDEAGKVA